jgi:hypothetical protein
VGNTLWHTVMGTLPAVEVMGVVGVLALLVVYRCFKQGMGNLDVVGGKSAVPVAAS